MIIHNVEQGSPEWLELRAGVVTASELHNLVTPLGKVCEGKGVVTYTMTKLAERWIGGPIQSFHGGAMEQGSLLEPEAIPTIAIETGQNLQRVGFLTTGEPATEMGCSPDAVVIEGGRIIAGYEIKCPQPVNAVRWALEGCCPPEHYLQCQGAMFVTGLSEWRFASYWRRLPVQIYTVERDEKVQKAIREALTAFNSTLGRCWEDLCNLNEGPPKRTTKPERIADPHPF